MACCPPTRLTRPDPPRLTRCAELPTPCPLPPEPPGEPCGVQTNSGGDGITTTVHHLGDVAGTVSITYEMFGVPDRLDAYYNGVLVATTGGPVSGSGTLTFEYPALRRKKNLTITITGGSGTAWIYTVSCPVPPAPEP